MAASNQELTTQMLTANASIKNLQERLLLTEQELLRVRSGGGSHARDDEKKLFPIEFEERCNFKEFAEELLD